MSQHGIELPVQVSPEEEPEAAAPLSPAARGARAGWRSAAAVAAIPVSALVAVGVHFGMRDRGLLPQTGLYPGILAVLLGVGLIGGLIPGVRGRLRGKAPLVAAATFTLAAWELITLKLEWLPLMYFPPPGTILQTLVDDRAQLFDSTWHSLVLLASGYAAGVVAGLVSGITMGWSSGFRYWGMPVLKIVGPIPATAWIPLALIVFPQSNLSGVALIALAVWFPVTMLTASGVSNVRASYLDVARTLGAGRSYLIFRVAIPAAMPSIFIGLFMGLGSSFLTLLVAESTGVRSGLGWYIDWAHNYSDYAKVFAALAIMAAFFSTIMTVLFKARDRALVWQKGVIKW
jgi:NitT/TauT family transport system permease protein